MMQDKKSTLLSLSAATLLLNTLSETVQADPPDQNWTVDYRYSRYQEGDIPSEDLAAGSSSRYTIDINQLKVKAPVSSDTELSVTGTLETMTGASPWYVIQNADGDAVQVMSGATIDETRGEVNVDFRSYNQSSESTVSASYSTENDYTSLSMGYSGDWRLNQNLTTINYGVSGSQDSINPSEADEYSRVDHENKSRIGGFVGFSQVIDKNRLLGANIGLTSYQGYLSDPYKLAWVDDAPVHDSRPDTQIQISGSFMWRQFFNGVNAALHADLSYFYNDWEVAAETADIGWYQNLGSGGWQLVPSVRLYHQSAAAFYAPYYSSTRADGYYSSDYRLSEYSAVSGRMKVSKAWSMFQVNLSYEHYQSFGDHPGLVDFDIFSLGLGTAF